MEKYNFVFDLDSTITKEEILPKLAKLIGIEKEMRAATNLVMVGRVPFETSFRARLEKLKVIKTSTAVKIINTTKYDALISSFIKKNKQRCYLMTGNLDIWITELAKKIGFIEDHIYCSTAISKNNYLDKVIHVVDKGKECKKLKFEYVSIGDGNNDVGVAKYAKISIGYGGARPIAPKLKAISDYKFYNSKDLVKFLNKLV